MKHLYHVARNTLQSCLGRWRMFGAVAVVVTLSACGGGGGGGADAGAGVPNNPVRVDFTRPSSENSTIQVEGGFQAMKGEVLATKSESVTDEQVTNFVKSKGWNIIGYNSDSKTYKVDTKAATKEDLNIAIRLIEESSLFGLVTKNYVIQRTALSTNDPLLSPTTGSYSAMWSKSAINAAAAWEQLYSSQTSKEVSIGIIDTNFVAHEDIDFASLENTSYKEKNENHGMHVAGIIAAKGNNSLGTAGISWSNGGVKLFPSSIASLGIDELALHSKWMRSNNVRAVNLSWGMNKCEPAEECTEVAAEVAIRKIVARLKAELMPIIKSKEGLDIIFVQGAGNAGWQKYANSSRNLDTSTSGHFAAATATQFLDTSDQDWVNWLRDHTLIVGAIAPAKSGDLYEVPDYVSLPKGQSDHFGRFIVAPGGQLCPCDAGNIGVVSLGDSEKYLAMSGTSMATPHVTGVLALMFQASNALTSKRALEIISETATVLNTTKGDFKLVSAEKAVKAVLATLSKPTATITIITPSPTAGSSVIFEPSITSSPNGGVSQYEWDFGDGTVQMGTSSQITHTYFSSGTYTVILKIKDTVGVTNTTTIKVTIAEKTNTPTCTINQTLVNNQCVTKTCPTGQSLVNGQCVTPTLVCTSPQVLQNGVCVTPALVCTSPQVLQNGVCVTPALTTQTITFGTAPTIAASGTGTLTATGGASGNPVILTSTTAGNCTVSGNTVTGVAQGTCTISATQAAGSGYSAGTANKTFTINAATLTCTAPQVLQNGVCVTPTPICTIDQTLVNNQCVTKTCPAGQNLVSGQCVTPSDGITTNPGQTVYSVTPSNATLGVPTTFAFRSSAGGLSAPLVFSLTNCVSVTALAGATQFEQQFTCTPTGTSGIYGGRVKSNAANTYGFDFSVTVSAAPASKYTTVGSYPITDCVKDTATGLIWEGKAISGLRAASNKYTNFDNTAEAQYMLPDGSALVKPTQALIDAATNSIGYVKAVNVAGLCGFTSGWRLPTYLELEGLRKVGTTKPHIDTAWFPNTVSNLYWTSTSYEGDAFFVDFGSSNAGAIQWGRRLSYAVRLVR